LQYVKHEVIQLADHPDYRESWVQQRIEEDPSILGLGELVVKAIEKIQPRAGRLDLLFQDPDEAHRYEVEIQLGPTDESHIIRTIEYWDIERRRYPQYEHTAVIVAEDITSRFLNVIGLFNGMIPLIAIQMQAIRVGGSVTLVFTKVLDETTLGLEEEDEAESAVADRAYWEDRGTKATLGMADALLRQLKQLDPALEMKYNKFYIGLARDGEPDNFVLFKPRKHVLLVEIRLTQSPEVDEKIESAGLDTLSYLKRWGKYRLSLQADDLPKYAPLLDELFRRAFTRGSRYRTAE